MQKIYDLLLNISLKFTDEITRDETRKSKMLVQGEFKVELFDPECSKMLLKT